MTSESFWRWLGRMFGGYRYARYRRDLRTTEAVSMAATLTLTAAVADQIFKTVDEATTSWVDSHKYYQRYWWLLVDPDDEARRRPSQRPTPLIWPPFMGHRVPLGGDRA